MGFQSAFNTLGGDDLAEVQFTAQEEEDIALMPRSLELAGRRILRTSPIRVPRRRGVQPVFFELPELRSKRETVDELGIIFSGTSTVTTLVSVELLFLPWAAWLPDPLEPAEMVAIGLESRRAKGLSDTRPLITTFAAWVIAS